MQTVIVIFKGAMSLTHNFLTPNSDENEISLYIITTVQTFK